MAKRIPADAFDYYFSLGPARSYQAVAAKYGVSKRSVTSLAGREGWQERLGKIEREARNRQDTKAVETLEQMHEKHLKALSFVLGKAIEALRALPLDKAIDAVRAIEMVLKQERIARGEPGERTALDLAEVVKRESARWLVSAPENGNGGGRP
jgi:hypothetical protein